MLFCLSNLAAVLSSWNGLGRGFLRVWRDSLAKHQAEGSSQPKLKLDPGSKVVYITSPSQPKRPSSPLSSQLSIYLNSPFISNFNSSLFYKACTRKYHNKYLRYSLQIHSTVFIFFYRYRTPFVAALARTKADNKKRK